MSLVELIRRDLFPWAARTDQEVISRIKNFFPLNHPDFPWTDACVCITGGAVMQSFLHTNLAIKDLDIFVGVESYVQAYRFLKKFVKLFEPITTVVKNNFQTICFYVRGLPFYVQLIFVFADSCEKIVEDFDLSCNQCWYTNFHNDDVLDATEQWKTSVRTGVLDINFNFASFKRFSRALKRGWTTKRQYNALEFTAPLYSTPYCPLWEEDMAMSDMLRTDAFVIPLCFFNEFDILKIKGVGTYPFAKMHFEGSRCFNFEPWLFSDEELEHLFSNFKAPMKICFRVVDFEIIEEMESHVFIALNNNKDIVLPSHIWKKVHEESLKEKRCFSEKYFKERQKCAVLAQCLASFPESEQLITRFLTDSRIHFKAETKCWIKADVPKEHFYFELDDQFRFTVKKHFFIGS
jgi:hypothetical protein